MSNELPTQDEFFENRKQNFMSQAQTAIFKCNCGGTVLEDLTMVLACYPPKHMAVCDKCGKVFYV